MHGFARLVINRTIDELHWMLGRLDEDLDAAEEWLRASLRTAQSTAWLRASLRTALAPTLNFSCRPHGKAAAVSRGDGKEIEWQVEEKVRWEIRCCDTRWTSMKYHKRAGWFRGRWNDIEWAEMGLAFRQNKAWKKIVTRQDGKWHETTGHEEVKWHDVSCMHRPSCSYSRCNEMQWDPGFLRFLSGEWDDMRWCWNEITRWNWHEATLNKMRWDENGWDEMRCDEIKLPERRASPRKGEKTWDGMRWAEKSREDMRWDELGWHRLRWHSDARSNLQENVRCNEIRWNEKRFSIQKAWHQIDKSRACCCKAQESCPSPIGTDFAPLYRL